MRHTTRTLAPHLAAALIASSALACAGAKGSRDTAPPVAAGGIKITPAADVTFQPLDPKAGDKGPQIAVVFGDLQAKGPLGILLKAPGGFSPGPHTHSSDDYAVGVRGTLHNFLANSDRGPG